MNGPRRAGFLLLVGLMLWAPSVDAHATPLRASPERGERLATAPLEAWVEFSEPVDPASVELRVLNGLRERVDEGGTQLNGSTIARTRVRYGLPSGGYLVQWEVLSSVDGHKTTGSWGFAIGNATIPAAETLVAPPLRWDAALGKGFAFIGLTFIAGALAMRVGVLHRIDESAYDAPLRTLALAGAGIHLAGLSIFSLSQADASGLLFVDYLWTTRFGRGVAVRLGLAAAMLAWIALSTRIPSRRAMQGLLGLGVVSLLLHGASSHTAALVRPLWAGALLDALHLGLVMAWAGGLVALVLVLGRPAIRDSLSLPVLTDVSRRFSRLAIASIIGLSATGVLMLATLLGTDLRTWGSALAGQYGRLLLLKIGLAVGMMGIGAANHYVFVAKYSRGEGFETRHAFHRNVRREAAVGLVVLLLAGAVTNLSPAVSVTAAQSEPAVVLEDDGEAYRFRLAIDPPPSVSNASILSALITDPVSGNSVDDAFRVRFTFEPPDPNLGATEILAEPKGNGTYEAQGSFFSVAGRWNVTVFVQTPDVFADSARFGVDVR